MAEEAGVPADSLGLDGKPSAPSLLASSTSLPGTLLASSTSIHGSHHLDASGLAGALGGIADAHNSLALPLLELARQLETYHSQLHAVKLEVQTLASKQHEDHQALVKEGLARQAKFESAQREGHEHVDGFRLQLVELSTKLDGQHRALRNLDEEHGPQLKALERSVEDLVAGQSEFTSRLLPRWRADVGTQVQRLEGTFLEHREHEEARSRKLEARLDSQTLELDKARTTLERRLNDEASSLNGRMAKAEERMGVTTELLQTVDERGGKVERMLSERLDIVSHAREDADAKLQAVRVDDHARLERLEAVFKQADFERMGVAERFTSDLEVVRTDTERLREWATKRFDASVVERVGASDKMQETVMRQVGTQVQDMKLRIAAAEENSTRLVAGTDTRLISETGVLRDRIESQGKLLDQRVKDLTKDECQQILNTIRSERSADSVRLEKFERSLAGAEGDRMTSTSQLERDVSSLRETARMAIDTETQKMHRQLEASAQAATTKFQPVEQAVLALTQEFQDFIRLQEQHDGDWNELVQLVGELEGRVMPWKAREQERNPASFRASRLSETADLGLSTASDRWVSSSRTSTTPLPNRLQEKLSTSMSTPSLSVKGKSAGKTIGAAVPLTPWDGALPGGAAPAGNAASFARAARNQTRPSSAGHTRPV